MPDKLLDRITAENTAVRKILDFLPYPFLLARQKNDDRENLFVNQSFIDEIGYSLEEIPTRSEWFIRAYPDPVYREQMKENWIKKLVINPTGTATNKVQAKIRTRYKGDLWFEVKSMQFDSIEAVAFININAIKTEEQNLQVLNNNKNRILSILGHDIRSPIYNLLSMSEMLLKENVSQEEFISVVQRLNLKTVQAMEFLETTLTWTKSNFEGILVNKEHIVLRDIVSSVVELYKTAFDNKKLLLTVEIPATLTFFTDKEIAIVVVRNLISNAIKYTNEGGSIYIQAIQRSDKNVFFVKDTGIGMSAQTIEALSGPPNYNSGYGTQQEKGLGIGLHLCKELLDLVGGNMVVESVEGKGSTFTILLPLV